jgi:hypothetical protein
VAAGLFVRGGARNITAQNAGIEALTWDVATEGSQKFPRAVLRKELARTGTGLTYGVNYDYSALSLISTRQNFDRAWEIFTDVALHPRAATSTTCPTLTLKSCSRASPTPTTRTRTIRTGQPRRSVASRSMTCAASTLS